MSLPNIAARSLFFSLFISTKNTWPTNSSHSTCWYIKVRRTQNRHRCEGKGIEKNGLKAALTKLYYYNWYWSCCLSCYKFKIKKHNTFASFAGRETGDKRWIIVKPGKCRKAKLKTSKCVNVWLTIKSTATTVVAWIYAYATVSCKSNTDHDNPNQFIAKCSDTNDSE